MIKTNQIENNTMKTINLLTTIILIGITFYSCKKDSSNTYAAKPLIQKITNNADQSYSTYQYVGTKVSKIIFNDGTYSTMEYSSLLVTEKDYSADSILGLTVIYTLNAEGYAI